MKNEFKVKGTVIGSSSDGYIWIEEEHTERPVMLYADRFITSYIDDVECSDLEEKYMTCEFIYTSLCNLSAIIVPSTDEQIPAKVVFSNWKKRALKFFGEAKIIDTKKPEPMSIDEWLSAINWAREKYETNLQIN